jgi:hypothetical protein
MADLLQHLINTKNVPCYDRTPAIDDTTLNELIIENLGDRKIFEISYEHTLHISSSTPEDKVVHYSRYFIGLSPEDENIQSALHFYKELGIYNNIDIKEKIIDVSEDEQDE